ncbi:MAG TPA: uracil-DNA glycosylase [Gammaproteobacteria bacterium]|nr:uracil-DNA glycosylase [Gammaproteobacteria bacterium]
MTDQNAYLELLDIIRWDSKNPPEIEPFEEFEKIEHCVKNCTKCDLHKTRTQTVFGTGNRQARVMFIGEAPGAEEDKQGKPFVGRAGQLLTQMLRAVGFSRDDVFIANILKCRPPNNRDPQADEVEQCTPYLKEQIELIKPDVLVALGRIASHFLLNTTTSLSKLRGQVFKFNNTPLLVTYHPAYLLRTPADKAKAYEDLKKIQEFL